MRIFTHIKKAISKNWFNVGFKASIYNNSSRKKTCNLIRKIVLTHHLYIIQTACHNSLNFRIRCSHATYIVCKCRTIYVAIFAPLCICSMNACMIWCEIKIHWHLSTVTLFVQHCTVTRIHSPAGERKKRMQIKANCLTEVRNCKDNGLTKNSSIEHMNESVRKNVCTTLHAGTYTYEYRLCPHLVWWHEHMQVCTYSYFVGNVRAAKWWMFAIFYLPNVELRRQLNFETVQRICGDFLEKILHSVCVHCFFSIAILSPNLSLTFSIFFVGCCFKLNRAVYHPFEFIFHCMHPTMFRRIDVAVFLLLTN